MRVRPTCLFAALLVAQAASFVHVARGDGQTHVSFEASGVLSLLLLAPATVTAAYGLTRRLERSSVLVVLVGSLASLALSAFLCGALQLGRAIGQLFALLSPGPTLEISLWPLGVTAGASALAFSLTVSLLLAPEPATTAPDTGS